MRRVGKALTFTALVAPMAAQGQDRPPTFYAMAADPSSMMRLGLDSIDEQGANTTFIVVNLFHGSLKTGVINTWKPNFTNGTMRNIKEMAFSPGNSGTPMPLKSETAKSSATAVSRTMYRLVCTEEGDRQSARTHHDELPVIIKRFCD